MTEYLRLVRQYIDTANTETTADDRVVAIYERVVIDDDADASTVLDVYEQLPSGPKSYVVDLDGSRSTTSDDRRLTSEAELDAFIAEQGDQSVIAVGPVTQRNPNGDPAIDGNSELQLNDYYYSDHYCGSTNAFVAAQSLAPEGFVTFAQGRSNAEVIAALFTEGGGEYNGDGLSPSRMYEMMKLLGLELEGNTGVEGHGDFQYPLDAESNLASQDWIAERIELGQPIMARGQIDGGGHWVMITGYRRLESGEHLYAVHDPWTDDNYQGGLVVWTEARLAEFFHRKDPRMYSIEPAGAD